MDFKFNFGTQPKTIFRWVISTIIITGAIGTLSKCSNLSEEKIWNSIIDYNRIFKGKFIPKDLLDYINNDPKILKIKINREVSSAIESYEKWESKNRKINMTNPTILREIKKSKYTEAQKIIIENAIYYELPPDGSYAQSLLGGEMGIRGSWVSK